MENDGRHRNTDTEQFEHLTRVIIGSAFKVANILGHGFVEKVYENALAVVLCEENLRLVQQYPINVYFHGKLIGNFLADLLVDERILVEVKACQAITNLHLAQTLNYLKASRLTLCLIINFTPPKVQVRRVVNGF